MGSAQRQIFDDNLRIFTSASRIEVECEFLQLRKLPLFDKLVYRYPYSTFDNGGVRN
jgi:hypothetical protein